MEAIAKRQKLKRPACCTERQTTQTSHGDRRPPPNTSSELFTELFAAIDAVLSTPFVISPFDRLVQL